jgi:hypothetical protein
MIQISTRIFVALTAALVATGSLLAFGWFMVNSAINRIVLLEVRVETLEKVLGSNRFDDQKAHRPPSGINKAGARCARIVPYAACGCHATPLRTGEKCPHDCSRVSRARDAVLLQRQFRRQLSIHPLLWFLAIWRFRFGFVVFLRWSV